MSKQREQQPSIRDAESVLADLEAKREKLIARGAELPALRQGAAYLAHVERNAEARRESLDKMKRRSCDLRVGIGVDRRCHRRSEESASHCSGVRGRRCRPGHGRPRSGNTRRV